MSQTMTPAMIQALLGGMLGPTNILGVNNASGASQNQGPGAGPPNIPAGPPGAPPLPPVQYSGPSAATLNPPPGAASTPNPLARTIQASDVQPGAGLAGANPGEINTSMLGRGEGVQMGPRGPIVSGPSGFAPSRVAAPSIEEQVWAHRFSQDANNPLINIMGGPTYGDPGHVKTRSEYNKEHPSEPIDAQTWARMMQAAGETAAGQNRSAIERATAFGTNGTPGSIQNSAAQVQSNVNSAGLPRQQQNQIASIYNTMLKAHLEAGNKADSFPAVWARTGLPNPFAPPTPEANAVGGVDAAHHPVIPPAAQNTEAGGGHGAAPLSRMENAIAAIKAEQSAGKPVAQHAIADPEAGIKDFINNLGEDFVRQHIGPLMEFMRHPHNFGATATDRWFSRGSPERTTVLNSINTARPGTVQPRAGAAIDVARGNAPIEPAIQQGRAEMRAFNERHSAAPQNIGNWLRRALGLEPSP